jgi:CBS-domain-containing membrane protein
MRVADLMTKSAVCCKLDDSLSVAAKLMWDCDCGSIPVVDSSNNVKGMITDRDICMSCFTKDRSPSNVKVQEAMSGKLYACSPDSSVQDAEATMRFNQVRRLPVLDGQAHLVGILSLADIAREAERERKQGRHDVSADDIVDVLGNICQPQTQSASTQASY